jgi:hypothetical protein
MMSSVVGGVSMMTVSRAEEGEKREKKKKRVSDVMDNEAGQPRTLVVRGAGNSQGETLLSLPPLVLSTFPRSRPFLHLFHNGLLFPPTSEAPNRNRG